MTSAASSRAFRLVIEPVNTDAYGVRLEETNGNSSKPPHVVAQIRSRDLAAVTDAVHQAVRESRHPRTILSSGRRKPVPLDEPAGVRLALALLAAGPSIKSSRRDAILSGIAAMSAEETYYWYAKATGPAATRATRALRILLADDGRTGLTA
jgi:hypothetical protein